MVIVAETLIQKNDSNLLKALKPEDQSLLEPHLQAARLESGTILYESGDDVHTTYFPCDDTLISYQVPLRDARAVETALIGREGAIGGIVSNGRLPAYCRAKVQSSGPVLHMQTGQLEKAKLQSITLHHFFSRYGDCLMAQISQNAACNAAHTIEQRTAKWLLAAMDRAASDIIPITQDEIAGMLGVGRSYVGRVLGTFRNKNVLRTNRGRLQIIDIDKLKASSCGCDKAVMTHFDKVLKGVYPQSGR